MMQRKLLFLSMLLFGGLLHLQAQEGFVVEEANLTTNTPRDIIEALCFGPGIEVVDISFEGVASAVGSFYGAAPYIGIDSGFVMTTGVVETSFPKIGVDETFGSNASVDNISQASYMGLMELTNSDPIEDVAIYRITFVPQNDSILFRYVFASEEYPTYVCSPFNDVFGFFLTGPDAVTGLDITTNLAVVPDTDLPVSINSVNSGLPGNHFSVDPDNYCEGENGSLLNSQYFVQNTSYPVYNGFTTIFVAEAAVVPCQTYTMELVIADAGDAFFDSAIFFEAESFCSFSGTDNVTTNIEADSPILIEGCDQNPIVLDLTGYPAVVFPLSYSIKGEATIGVDYDSLQNRGVIEEPTDSFVLHIQTIADGLMELGESVQIIFTSDDCVSDTLELYIIDGLAISGPPAADCSAGPVTLGVEIANAGLTVTNEQVQGWLDNLSYSWSTGDSTRYIEVNPTETTTYVVEYGNALNSCVDSFTVVVGATESTIDDTLCFNEPGIEVNGTIYNLLNPTGTEILETADGCDSIININLSAAASETFSGTFCENETFEFGGQVFDITNPEGTALVAGGGTDGCDLVVHVDLAFLESSISQLESTICANEEVTVKDNTFDINNPSGEVVLEGAAANGCDSIVQVQLSFYPIDTAFITGLFCKEDSLEVNGTVYDFVNQDGFEVLPGASVNGCDSIIMVDLTYYDTPEPGFVTPTLCSGESIIINGVEFNEDFWNDNQILPGADQNGCDSVVVVSVSFYPPSESSESFTINEGETVNYNGETLSTNGQYTYVFTNQNGCDSTVTVNVLVKPITETVTDSIAIGQTELFCINADFFSVIDEATVGCDDGQEAASFILDVDNCVKYVGEEVGIDEACVIICGDSGLCDTTYFVISVFTNLLDAVDDYDTTAFDSNIALDVLANDWTSATILTDFYIVSPPAYGSATIGPDNLIEYDPDLVACDQEDQFTYAICNAIGCDTATVYLYLQDAEGLCDAVWPGDVGNDGLVNQLDFWAVGLGFGQNGPIRPDATIEWTPQPAIDWPGTITFINVINLKYADCNGDGMVNVGDNQAIYQNWGLTHNLTSAWSAYPPADIPLSANPAPVSDNWIELDLETGETEDFYGFYFQLDYDPQQIDDSQLAFELSDSWAGDLGYDLMVLEKPFIATGKAHFALVRTDQQARNGSGTIGKIRAKLRDGFNQGSVSFYISRVQLLKANGSIFSLQGTTTTVDATTDTDDATWLEAEVQVFPNPSNGNFQVQLPDNAGSWQVQVLDTSGALHFREKGNANTIEVAGSNLTPGIYLLRIQTEKGLVNKKICITP